MRAPDFLIIGAMKAGSTSLWRWLEAHPDVALPAEKEPNFFSDDRVWRRGERWYRGLFPAEGVTGEASVAYSDPALAESAAARAGDLAPEARLLFIARDPVARMRSHYRHEVLRGRERRRFEEIVAQGGERYARMSRYDEGLAPWRERFGDACRVLSFRALTADDEREWHAALAHLGLDPIDRPAEVHNQSASKTPYRPMMRLAYDHGAARLEKLVPRSVKRVLRPFLLGTSPQVEALLKSSHEPVPEPFRQALWDATATASP